MRDNTQLCIDNAQLFPFWVFSPGPGVARGRDGPRETEDGTRGAVPRVLHPGVGGVLCPGPLPSLPEQVHSRQPGHEERTHRITREATRSESVLSSKCSVQYSFSSSCQNPFFFSQSFCVAKCRNL